MDSRSLYLAVAELVDFHRHDARSLEDFLRTVHAALVPRFGEPALAPEALVRALEEGFTAPAVDRDPTWRQADLTLPDQAITADAVDRLLRSQVLDMEDAAASGALQDELRYFGREVGRAKRVRRASSPYYYNWNPVTYIECGVAGAFGGWEPGDAAGRMLVPGEVAVLTDEGLTSLPAEDVEQPVVDLPVLTWEQVYDFLWCGQSYE
jgi:hypothetical protein